MTIPKMPASGTSITAAQQLFLQTPQHRSGKVYYKQWNGFSWAGKALQVLDIPASPYRVGFSNYAGGGPGVTVSLWKTCVAGIPARWSYDYPESVRMSLNGRLIKPEELEIAKKSFMPYGKIWEEYEEWRYTYFMGAEQFPNGFSFEVAYARGRYPINFVSAAEFADVGDSSSAQSIPWLSAKES